MGTTYHVRIAAAPPVDLAVLQADIETLLGEIDRQMSTYRQDSELSRFNRAPTGDWFPVSADTAHVVAAARQISEMTGGALDVTVGPLVRLWHFGPTAQSDRQAHRSFEPPPAASVETAKKSVGYRKLEVRLEPPALRKQVASLEVDLSSIAPGFTIDRMAESLVQRGVKDFTVELGGEVRSSGTRVDGAPWRVAIERPLPGQHKLLRSVPLIDAAIATAGDYRNFFTSGGRRYSHIIDPAIGQPVNHSLASVTVVADTCLAADGWDTPLLVLGAEQGYECAEKNGIAAMFVSPSTSGDSIVTTTAWKARFRETENQH
jgi:thiamine biosynthesis lipoprotein